MLTVHDCTFEMRWSGWGPYTQLAERTAAGTYLYLLRMPPAQVHKLAKSKRALATMTSGARLTLRQQLEARGAPVPPSATISLEVINA